MSKVYVVLNPSLEGAIFHGVFGSSEEAEEVSSHMREEGCCPYIVEKFVTPSALYKKAINFYVQKKRNR